MMIIRTSATLNKKIHVNTERSMPLSENPYADWSARLFTAGRAQYIMVTNTLSLYSVLMHGRGITDERMFFRQAVTAIREQLALHGGADLFERLIAPQTNNVMFAKALNPSVTGSINDFVYQTKHYLADGGLSLLQIAQILSRSPMSALHYASPSETFEKITVAKQ